MLRSASTSRRPCGRDGLAVFVSRLTLGALCAAVLGCGPAPESAPAGAQPDRRRPLRIAVIPKGTTHVFWKSIEAGARTGARQAEAEHGVKVEVIWQGPLEEGDREGQRQIVETFAGQPIDGIVLAPVDEHALVPAVEQAAAAGKPVVIIDSGLKGERYLSFVATNNHQGGVLAARRLGQLLGGKGKALLLRYMAGSASTTEREQGFIDTVQKEFAGIALVPPGLVQYAGDTVGRAQNAAETLLNTYPDIDAIFCPNESRTTGMLEAIAKTGRAARARFVGFDANDKLVEALLAGRMHGLVLQDPVGMAAQGVRHMVEHLLGKPVPRRVETPVVLVTGENVQTPEMQRLLKPDLTILQGR